MSINAAAAWALYVRASWRIVRGFSRRGGTGRRDGLKIRFPQGSVGSTPSAGRIFEEKKNGRRRASGW
jgi:hypothetical protein